MDGNGEPATVVTLGVRSMTDAEFGAWHETLARSYAGEQVTAGNRPPAGALEEARREISDLLPAGPATAGMLLLRGVRPDGVAVGSLWIALAHPRGTPDCAFLYDLTVDPGHRGAGLGRSLLAAAEDAVRAAGVGALMLNVFAANTRARSLYERCGYAVVTQQLRRDLGPPAAPWRPGAPEGSG
ncbi:hypothetical protein NUM3379_27770 [Kineococcus sp. NUM-3379]